ncbi:hypothetical protein KC19_3G198800 [Ceratodon purpureus]|uniref:Uncharacterized protein n=1 Tax=Ceratodon purpureus TaxID=3225 RepID=A0A8T0IKG6_CERPU|nr:hypothetical protein KC19_3G198800 [Ceratodon purpureus]
MFRTISDHSLSLGVCSLCMVCQFSSERSESGELVSRVLGLLCVAFFFLSSCNRLAVRAIDRRSCCGDGGPLWRRVGRRGSVGHRCRLGVSAGIGAPAFQPAPLLRWRRALLARVCHGVFPPLAAHESHPLISSWVEDGDSAECDGGDGGRRRVAGTG